MDTAEVFCGRAFQGTQVQQSPERTYPSAQARATLMPVAFRSAHLDRGCSPSQPLYEVFLNVFIFYLQRHNEGLSRNKGAAAGAADPALGSDVHVLAQSL